MRVAVLMGGRSSERDVSLASGRSICAGLTEAGHEPLPIEIPGDGHWEAGSIADAAVVFPALHGPFGEDGTVQGLLDLLDLPYVGSGVAGSAVAMDKALFKDVMRANDIPTAESVTLRRGETLQSPFELPLVVKPARLGSSVGISIAATSEELEAAVELARKHDDKVLLERFVDGREVECSVLGNDDPDVSVPGEIIVLKGDWYDYEAKYTEGGMELIAPAELDNDVSARAQQLSVRAFEACECAGMARVDCFVEADGTVLVNELNTIPGFTSTSVYAKLFEASGVDYTSVLQRLIDCALERHERRSALAH